MDARADALVLFGATCDMVRKKLIPAIYELACAARRPWTISPSSTPDPSGWPDPAERPHPGRHHRRGRRKRAATSWPTPTATSK
jgi:hypothetical protein